jgi:adenylate cyclase
MKARQLFMKRENFKETERLFRLSLKADSTFDLAYSGLAASIQFIISYGNGDSTTNVLANKEATYYAKRALLLDSLNAEAYSVLGLLHDFRNELLQARLFHEKSLKINPTISTANLWYGQHLYQVGHFTEAHAFVEKAANQEPLYGINHIWLAQIDVALMNIDEGLEHARKAKNSGIGFWGEYVVMSLFMESGQWASLEKFINDNPDLTSDWKAEFLKWVNYSRNKSKQLAPWIKEDVSIPERLPEVYYWSGNYEKAIQIINRYGVVGQALFQGRKELRKHPGFKTAAIKFGYLDYWKRYGGPDFCPDIIKNNLECN